MRARVSPHVHRHVAECQAEEHLSQVLRCRAPLDAVCMSRAAITRALPRGPPSSRRPPTRSAALLCAAGCTCMSRDPITRTYLSCSLSAEDHRRLSLVGNGSWQSLHVESRDSLQSQHVVGVNRKSSCDQQ